MSVLAPCLLRLRAGRDHVVNAVRGISTSYTAQKWKFTEKVENDVTVVGMEEVPEPVPPSSAHCALCTCSIPVKLSYR
ncbi:hypothetical protein GCK32_022319 [Trichostrongylus colubriformis]|uniref:Uncharacterized protein n=1 Tax=Trichostrongylus colubriformis TaxID=6319 RepID=A0AAN8IV38_TRICO